jgi:hypothetical protein
MGASGSWEDGYINTSSRLAGVLSPEVAGRIALEDGEKEVEEREDENDSHGRPDDNLVGLLYTDSEEED